MLQENKCKEEMLTVGLLKELMGNRNIPQLSALINGRADDELMNLINKDNFVAVKAWGSEEIADVMEEKGYKVTSERLENVLSRNELNVLEEITEQDKLIIGEAIDKALCDVCRTFKEINVEFEERYDDAIAKTTTLYFIAPKELLHGKYPDAESMEISLEFPTAEIVARNAMVSYSPTKDGEDYDWYEGELTIEGIKELLEIADDAGAFCKQGGGNCNE